jgi:four helix bundle protein
MAHDLSQDIRDRTFRFGCGVARYSLGLAPRPGVRTVIDQLLRSGTGIGANLEEAKAASSKKEFIRFTEISLREARESHYWIRICLALGLGETTVLDGLLAENDEIIRILVAIVVSAKRRMITGYVVFAFCISAFCILNSALLTS